LALYKCWGYFWGEFTWRTERVSAMFSLACALAEKATPSSMSKQTTSGATESAFSIFLRSVPENQIDAIYERCTGGIEP
jgi:hypothetical protein